MSTQMLLCHFELFSNQRLYNLDLYLLPGFETLETFLAGRRVQGIQALWKEVDDGPTKDWLGDRIYKLKDVSLMFNVQNKLR